MVLFYGLKRKVQRFVERPTRRNAVQLARMFEGRHGLSDISDRIYVDVEGEMYRKKYRKAYALVVRCSSSHRQEDWCELALFLAQNNSDRELAALTQLLLPLDTQNPLLVPFRATYEWALRVELRQRMKSLAA